TSVPRRRCSRTSRRCMPCFTGRRGCARSASASTAWRARRRMRSSPPVSARRTPRTSTPCGSKARRPPRSARRRKAPASTSGMSLQPNSGAQGEFAGLMVIRAFHRDRGEDDRDVVLIPSSAHGTNPASATMAGLRVVVVACDEHGYVEVDDLRAKAQQHRDALAALMVTYPSTYGIFEERIREICAIVHEHGGQVYMDGANMNAQVGLTS